MEFYIGQYWPLSLLVFFPFVVHLSRHSLTGLSSVRKWTSLVLRILLLLLLVLALCNIQMVQKSRLLSVLFLMDFSESVPQRLQEQGLTFIRNCMDKMDPRHDRAGLLVFAKDSSFEFVERPKGFPVSIQSQIETNQTDIAKAIKLAVAGLPDIGQRRIVLLSDGNQTLGNGLEEARQARTHEISIDVVPLSLKVGQEIILEKVIAPGEVSENQAYEVMAILKSFQDTSGSVRLTLNGETIREKNVNLTKGKNSVVLTVPAQLSKSGFQRLRVTVESPEDTVVSNNTAETFTYIHGLPKILYIENDPEHAKPLLRALTEIPSARQRTQVVLGTTADLPGDILSLHSYDALILSNVPRQYLSEAQMKMIENGVKEGGLGLIMIGGENSFGAGGYRNTPIERALPVEMDITHKKVVPNGALVLVLHTCEFSEGNRWAKIISKKAIESLSPADLAGILYFDWKTQESWLFPLMEVKNKNQMFRLIDDAAPGDMPSFGPTLQASYNALSTARAGKKHIVIITDGDPTPPSMSLLTQIRDGKISISGIVIQPHGGQDTQRMQSMASYTGGRYYRVDDPNRLPEIFAREALTVKRNLIFESEEGFRPVLQYHTDPIRGIGADEFPRLYGYVVTSIKPLASMPLYLQQEDQKDPLLAHMQYGLGRTVAFTSDAKNRWAADWVSWEKYQKFWLQTLHWALRKIERSSFRIATSTDQGKGKIAIDAVSADGKLVNFLRIRVAVVYPSGKSVVFQLEQTGPGRYEGDFQADEVGTYLITGNYEQGEGTKHFSTGILVSYSSEYMAPGPNYALLKEIAEISGGRLIRCSFLDVDRDGKVSKEEWEGNGEEFARLDQDSDGFISREEAPDENVFSHQKPKGGHPADLWPFFLTLFLFLFPLDVFVRRVMLDYRKIWQRLSHRSKKEASSPATFQRLAQKKEKLKERLHRKTITENLKKWEQSGLASSEEEKGKEPAKSKISMPPEKKKEIPVSKPEEKGPEGPATTYTGRLLDAKKKVWEKRKKE